MSDTNELKIYLCHKGIKMKMIFIGILTENVCCVCDVAYCGIQQHHQEQHLN
jgi:hypothetical protein